MRVREDPETARKRRLLSILSVQAPGTPSVPSKTLRRAFKQTNMAVEDGSATEARIAVTKECRELLRDQKRGCETFDSVLRKMVEQHGSRTEGTESRDDGTPA